MENVLASVEATGVRNLTGSNAGASRLRVEGFTGWKRRWLMALIATQILCENLLLVDGAIAARKTMQRYKRKAQGRPDGYQN